ncbi:hypothetical protein AGMMS4956_19490 [Bacteroidia bacterium]|nr:hypothetical protein AGMMS4956_19490 [Bacteroidia bacterium]
MEELAKFILELLQTHNRVSLPGIGSFLASDAAASIDEATGTIAPPTKKIIFSKRETWNDGLLESLYSEVYGWTEEEAAERVKHIMMSVRFELDDRGKVNFPGLGNLRLGKQNKIDLEQSQKTPFSINAFGLAPITLNSLSSKKTTEKKVSKKVAEQPVEKSTKKSAPRHADDDDEILEPLVLPKKRIKNPLEINTFTPHKAALIILAGLVSVIVAIGAFLMLSRGSSKNQKALLPPESPINVDISSYLPSDNSELEELPTAAADNFYEETPAATPPASRPPVAAEKKVATESVAPKNRTQYCVLVANISTLKQAQATVKSYVSAGYQNCHIVDEKNGGYRIAINCFTNKNDALRECAEIKKIIPDAWVFEKKY